MKSQAPRKFNFRPLFYGFLAFAIGIASAYYLFSLNIAVIIVLSIIFAFCMGFAIFKRRFVNFLIIIACFILGAGAYFVEIGSLNSTKFSGGTYEITARATTNIYAKENYTYVIMDNVKVDGKPAGKLALGIYTYDGFEVETGMKLKFTAEVYDQLWFENQSFNGFAYKMKAKHYAFVESGDLEVLSTGHLTFSETVRLYTKNLLHQHMPFETAELSYSILFGDQTMLDEDIKNSFSTSGLGHLVAVSGLNIAVLVACMYGIMRLFKVPKVAKFFVMCGVLLIYSYLCGFVPSVSRASIMAIVFLGFTLLGRQYDLLSSLGIAGFVILIFNPFAVFDAGFLMSFLCVIAIGFFVQPISRFLNQKVRVPTVIADSFAISLVTTLAIAPVLALYFAKISVLSLVVNMICVPLFSLAYIMVFILVIVVSVFGFLGFLLILPHWILQFIIIFAAWIATLEFSIVEIYSLSIIGAAAFYMVLFFSSKMFISPWVQRLFASSLTIFAAFILVFAVQTPKIPASASYTQIHSHNTSIVLILKNGEVLVVSNGETDATESYLRGKNFRKVDTLVLVENPAPPADFIKKYSVDNVLEMGAGLKYYGDFGVKYIYQNGGEKGVLLFVEDIGILVATERIGDTQAVNIKTLISGYDVDILYENRYTKNFINAGDFDYVFSHEKVFAPNNFATNLIGSFTFSISGGIMGDIRSVN